MKERYGEIAKQILGILGIAGVVIIAAAAPGALLAVRIFDQNGQTFSNKQQRQKAARTIQRLQKANIIRVREGQGKIFVELTKAGKTKFKELESSKLKIAKPAFWDKKWRIVIFDIPDKSFKQGRDALRGKLKEWDFYQLQKSVWVCPWPCENEIRTIADLYELSPYINTIVAEKIDNDAEARKHFGV